MHAGGPGDAVDEHGGAGVEGVLAALIDRHAVTLAEADLGVDGDKAARGDRPGEGAPVIRVIGVAVDEPQSRKINVPGARVGQFEPVVRIGVDLVDHQIGDGGCGRYCRQHGEGNGAEGGDETCPDDTTVGLHGRRSSDLGRTQASGVGGMEVSSRQQSGVW